MKKPVGPYDSYYRYKCIDNRNAESGKIDQICFSRRYTNYMNMSSHNIVMFHSSKRLLLFRLDKYCCSSRVVYIVYIE